MAGKVSDFLLTFYFWDQDGCRANKEHILSQWQHPAASSNALNPLHLAMLMALHWCFSVAVEIGCFEDTFGNHQQFCLHHNVDH